PVSTVAPGDVLYVTLAVSPAATATSDANVDGAIKGGVAGNSDATPAAGSTSSGGSAGASTGGDEQVRLGDIAEIVREPEAASSISRSNGKGSLGLLVFKERGKNTVKVVDDVKARIDELQNENDDLDALDVNLVFEQSSFIKESLNGVRNEGILGGLFAILIILWFLRSIRSTIVIAVSIPLSILTALVLMRAQGLSLNLLTISALTIAIGRVVDDAIVVIENIYRNLQRGVPRRQAILQGAGEVATAITAATLVTVAVFLPLGFVGGLTREFFLPFGQTVTYALLASLIVALTVIPLLASWWLTPESLPAERETTLQRVYTPILRWALGHRAVTLIIALAFFAFSLLLVRYIPRTFLGGFGEPGINITVSLPTGATLETTDEVVKLVENVLDDDDAIHNIETTIGSGSADFGQFSGGDSAKATIRATLVKDPDNPDAKDSETTSSWSKWFKKSKREDPEVVAQRLRDELHDLNDIDEIKKRLGRDLDENDLNAEMARLRTVLGATNIVEGRANEVFEYAVSVGAGGGPPAGVYDLQVRGDDERDVRKATALVLAAIKDPDEWDTEGYDLNGNDPADATLDDLPIINIKSNLTEARQALTVAVNPAKAQAKKLSTIQVALALRAIFEGQEVGKIEMADGKDGASVSKLDVLAVYPDDLITDKTALENYMLDAPGGGKVRLGDIAEVSLRAGAVEITRVNGQRAAIISGEITDTDTFGIQASAGTIIDRVKKDHEDLFGHADDTKDPPVTVGTGAQSGEQQNSFNDLLLALPISILIVYLIMVLEFGSLAVPFAILFSLPFAATGAFISLAITGRALSLSSLIGMLMLIGIVVTNAIVLLDFVQQLRKRGYSVNDALIEGGRTRVRPIMMTAVATVIALIPQALGFTKGALLASELATTVIGGLTTSTLLTLVVVPVLYSLFAGMAGQTAASTMMPTDPDGTPPPPPPPPGGRPSVPVPAMPSPGPRPPAPAAPVPSTMPAAPAPATPPPAAPPPPALTGGAVPAGAPVAGAAAATPPMTMPASPSPFAAPPPVATEGQAPARVVPAAPAETPPTPPSRQPYEGPEVTWSSRGGAAAAPETTLPPAEPEAPQGA
ncbi:MAG: efflux RND transporter permease subunit, partial [Ardenticatenales bacterium]